MSTIPLRRSGVRYQHWRDRAACLGEEPELFFPEPGAQPGEHGSARRAKRICAGCPVKAECLGNALSFPERHGVWGGLAERERRGMRPAPDPATPERQAA